MVDSPNVTVTIDRTSLTLPPLALSGRVDGTLLGIVSYSPPSKVARITYAPESRWVHGSLALASTWQQTFLAFEVVTDKAATETAAAAVLAELEAAVGQFSFVVTTKVSDAPAETWAADMGSVAPVGGRSLPLMSVAQSVVAVTIPVYPIPS